MDLNMGLQPLFIRIIVASHCNIQGFLIFISTEASKTSWQHLYILICSRRV